MSETIPDSPFVIPDKINCGPTDLLNHGFGVPPRLDRPGESADVDHGTAWFDGDGWFDSDPWID